MDKLSPPQHDDVETLLTELSHVLWLAEHPGLIMAAPLDAIVVTLLKRCHAVLKAQDV